MSALQGYNTGVMIASQVCPVVSSSTIIKSVMILPRGVSSCPDVSTRHSPSLHFLVLQVPTEKRWRKKGCRDPWVMGKEKAIKRLEGRHFILDPQVLWEVLIPPPPRDQLRSPVASPWACHGLPISSVLSRFDSLMAVAIEVTSKTDSKKTIICYCCHLHDLH